jgi:peptidoglycan hydrolase-like protein with peptidoglycan-binding domain
MSRPGIGRRVRARAALGCIATLAFALAVTASAQAQLGDRTLKVGSKGSDVKAAQRALTAVGIRTKADGVYGRGTARNVKRWERNEHRRADGKLQPSDARKLENQAGDGTGLEDPSSGDAATGTGGAAYSTSGPGGARATLGPDGRTATAPDSAPQQVKDAISAANSITNKPYKYGGGHGSWTDSGYDCSGAVSFALHGGGLLDKPMDSTELERFGASGAGQWITVYANSGHAFVVIAGLRFDTSGSGEDGPRWRTEARSTSGYVVRHPDGL